jgi:hypothetical protein
MHRRYHRWVAPRAPGDGILHPVTIGAMALLILNDHVLKEAFPGVVTGKLSDVAGLAFFPTLLVGLMEVVSRKSLPPPFVWASVVATGVVFALTKTWEPAAEAYRLVLGCLQWPFRALLFGETQLRRVLLAQDPTDLAALPALFIPLWLGLKRLK